MWQLSSPALEIVLAGPWRASLRSGEYILLWFMGIRWQSTNSYFGGWCESVHQQVHSFTGWKWFLQPHRSNRKKNLALQAHHLRDALTCVTCGRRSTITGKVPVLTSRPAVCFCVCLSVRFFKTTWTVFVFSRPQIFFSQTLDGFLCAFLKKARDDGKKSLLSMWTLRRGKAIFYI